MPEGKQRKESLKQEHHSGYEAALRRMLSRNPSVKYCRTPHCHSQTVQFNRKEECPIFFSLVTWPFPNWAPPTRLLFNPHDRSTDQLMRSFCLSGYDGTSPA